jgi:hypothetical protein
MRAAWLNAFRGSGGDVSLVLIFLTSMSALGFLCLILAAGVKLRTELVVNHTRDFGIGKALDNLPRLRELAFAANRRLLHVQQLRHDPIPGEDAFQTMSLGIPVIWSENATPWPL